MKRSRFAKPDYALTFGNDDVIFLDVVLIITEDLMKPAGERYSVVIESCRLATQMEFARYVVNTFLEHSSATALTIISEKLQELLLADVASSLHSLFYAGDIINENPTV